MENVSAAPSPLVVVARRRIARSRSSAVARAPRVSHDEVARSERANARTLFIRAASLVQSPARSPG